jgi:hypothetical protein
VKVVNGVDAELDLFCQFTQSSIALADFILEKSRPDGRKSSVMARMCKCGGIAEQLRTGTAFVHWTSLPRRKLMRPLTVLALTLAPPLPQIEHDRL